MSIYFGFDPHDLWIGVYWKYHRSLFTRLDIWICLIPCLPIHLTFKIDRHRRR